MVDELGNAGIGNEGGDSGDLTRCRRAQRSRRGCIIFSCGGVTRADGTAAGIADSERGGSIADGLSQWCSVS